MPLFHSQFLQHFQFILLDIYTNSYLQEVCSQIWATLYDYPSLKVQYLSESCNHTNVTSHYHNDQQIMRTTSELRRSDQVHQGVRTHSLGPHLPGWGHLNHFQSLEYHQILFVSSSSVICCSARWSSRGRYLGIPCIKYLGWSQRNGLIGICRYEYWWCVICRQINLAGGEGRGDIQADHIG